MKNLNINYNNETITATTLLSNIEITIVKNCFYRVITLKKNFTAIDFSTFEQCLPTKFFGQIADVDAAQLTTTSFRPTTVSTQVLACQTISTSYTWYLCLPATHKNCTNGCLKNLTLDYVNDLITVDANLSSIEIILIKNCFNNSVITLNKTFSISNLNSFEQCLPPKIFGQVTILNSTQSYSRVSTLSTAQATTSAPVTTCNQMSTIYSNNKKLSSWTLCYSSTNLACNGSVRE